MELSDDREIGKIRKKGEDIYMLETKFSEKELTEICQLLKRHGTDCATLVDILRFANVASPNDAGGTYKHIRLLKEFSILKDRDILCHTCISEVIERHADTCEEWKKNMTSDYPLPCPEDHYDYSRCEPAVWMVDWYQISRLEDKAAKMAFEEGKKEDIHMIRKDPISWDDKGNVTEFGKDTPHFTHTARTRWLEENFPDIPSDIRFNPWMGFLCEKHIGSMRPYANRIIGYC